jgi:hypothetical protein
MTRTFKEGGVLDEKGIIMAGPGVEDYVVNRVADLRGGDLSRRRDGPLLRVAWYGICVAAAVRS